MIHTVKHGECLSLIAKRYGFFWRTIWELNENDDFRTKRKDPNVIYPGDEVFIPDKDPIPVDGKTEQRHRFLLKGVPNKLFLRILDDNHPLAKKPWSLTIDGFNHRGETSEKGDIVVTISPSAREGKLTIQTDDGEVVHELILGELDPQDEIIGAQARLNNLGYDSGPEDDIFGPMTKRAAREFQKEVALQVDGVIGPKTQKALRERYDGGKMIDLAGKNHEDQAQEESLSTWELETDIIEKDGLVEGVDLIDDDLPEEGVEDQQPESDSDDLGEGRIFAEDEEPIYLFGRDSAADDEEYN